MNAPDRAAILSHLDLSTNHEAGLIPVATQSLLRLIADNYVPAGQVVKPLDFEKHPDEQEWYSITYEDGDVAEFGYMVLPCKKSKFRVYTITNGKPRKIGKPFILAGDAMAFANSVHSRRILSALTTQSTTYDEAFAAGLVDDETAFKLAKAILDETEGEWEPSIPQSFRILSALRNQPQGDDE